MVNIHDAKAQLSRLIERASAGEEIVIARAGKPVARLMPLEPTGKPRASGLLKGKMRVGADFDAPLPDDLLALFEGKVLPGPKPKARKR